LVESSSKRNVAIGRPSVYLSVCPVFFLTLMRRAAHTQPDSPGSSMRHGQCTFPSEYYEDGHT